MSSLPWIVVVALVATSASLACADGSDTGTLVVQAFGFGSEKGQVLIQVANSRRDYEADDEGFRAARIPTSGGRAEHRFEHLPYGEYAIKLFHDENSNRELDIGWMGPEERYGFSNGARGFMGPPDWDEAKFTFEQVEQTIRIEAR